MAPISRRRVEIHTLAQPTPTHRLPKKPLPEFVVLLADRQVGLADGIWHLAVNSQIGAGEIAVGVKCPQVFTELPRGDFQNAFAGLRFPVGLIHLTYVY